MPDLRLVDKRDVPAMRALSALVRPFSPDFLDRYTTVIGSTVYLPAPPHRIPQDELARILCHELVHQLDQRRWGPLFYASYVLPPAGRTWRAVWERRAYASDLLIARLTGGEPAVHATVRRLVSIFSGPGYLFMWAGAEAARRFLTPAVDDVLTGRIDSRPPYDAIRACWAPEAT